MSISNILSNTQIDALTFQDTAIAITGSFVGAVLIFVLYTYSYGRKNTGSGVDRMFLIGGPAITAMLLAIQYSLPLSLGLLGALSIVRFRTPVKDPAEIGFVLVLIASSIAFATLKPWLSGSLIGVAALGLALDTYLRRGFAAGRSLLVLNLATPDAMKFRSELDAVVLRHLPGAKLQSVSTFENAPTLSYVFSAHQVDTAGLEKELGSIAPVSIGLYLQ